MDCLIVVMLSWLKGINIQRPQDMCKMKEKFKRNNLLHITLDSKLIFVVDDMAIKKKNMPMLGMRAGTNIHDKVIKLGKYNILIGIPCL